MPSNKTLQKKQQEVVEIAEKIKNAKAIIIVEYRGVNAGQITQIRADLRKSNAEYRVTKNNITKRAFKENNISELDQYLTGPVAVVYGNEDYLEPAKVIYNFAKENDFYKIKAGVIDGEVKTAEEIITLAKLPSRETLIAMLAGGLLGTISKLAVALDQVKMQKENA